jgi:hypothetical protein
MAAPAPSQPAIREQVAGAPAARPSWPRTARPSLGQSAATAARPGLPPATVEAEVTTSPGLVDVDPAAGPVCPSCHRRHPAPAELPVPMARRLAPPTPPDPRIRGAAPPGWGRDRRRCS